MQIAKILIRYCKFHGSRCFSSSKEVLFSSDFLFWPVGTYISGFLASKVAHGASIYASRKVTRKKRSYDLHTYFELIANCLSVKVLKLSQSARSRESTFQYYNENFKFGTQESVSRPRLYLACDPHQLPISGQFKPGNVQYSTSSLSTSSPTLQSIFHVTTRKLLPNINRFAKLIFYGV